LKKIWFINSIKNNKTKFKKILNLCEEEFYLFKKWYISKTLWEKIEHKIEKNLSSIILYISKNKWTEQKKYIWIFWDDNILTYKKWFWIYIIEKLKELKEDFKIVWDNKIKNEYITMK